MVFKIFTVRLLIKWLIRIEFGFVNLSFSNVDANNFIISILECLHAQCAHV
jgi:hypothetical protein